MTGCTLCDLPTPDPPLTADGVSGQYCCRGCLEVARNFDDVGTDPAAADLGIALVSGTELAVDAAAAIVTTDDLTAIPDLFRTARGTRARIWQNLGWAFTYNASPSRWR